MIRLCMPVFAAWLLLAGVVFAVEPAAPAQPAATLPETVVPANRDGQRHRLIVERAKKGGVDLLFLGDSITQGWEVNGREVWDKLFTPRLAMNAGISGDRTQHVLWRIEHGAVDGLKPKVVVLMIGTNNSAANTGPEIAQGVKAIVDLLRAKLPETKVLVLAIFPRGQDGNDARRKVNEAANREIARLADDEHVFFLDIGRKFLGDDGTLSTEIMPDLLHLSPRGYEIWGEAIEPMLTKLMDS